MRLAGAVVVAGVVAVAALASASDGRGGSDLPVRQWLVTDRSSYEAVGLPNRADLRVGLRYTNRSRTPRYFKTCHGPTELHLEKLMNGVWVRAFGQIVLLCQGPTLTVRPGETHALSFAAQGAVEELSLPAWDVDEVPGTYRARWRSYRRVVPERIPGEKPGLDEELLDPEDAVSAPFEIVAAFHR